MSIAISPHYTSGDFQKPYTLDNKIVLFVDRVGGWQIGVAENMIQKQVPDRGFAILAILMSYFEMIAKHHAGFVGREKVGEHFKMGVRLVFSGIEPEAEPFLDSLYDGVRNGLYHTGLTGGNVLLTDDIPGSFGYDTRQKMVMVRPDKLAGDIRRHFTAFAADLRNPANAELRSNFQKRFDSYDPPPA